LTTAHDICNIKDINCEKFLKGIYFIYRQHDIFS
jgi:hypothetical protein